MNTNYKGWINYDNDKKTYCFPVLPEKIKVTVKGHTSSVTIDRFGEILHKGKRGAITISFPSFFPAVYSASYCSCQESQFRKPEVMHDWMLYLLDADKPAHIVFTGGPLNINFYADITSYTAEEAGGDVGTINYSIELKEHREVNVRTYKKTAKGNKVSGSTKKRVSNKAPTNKYKVSCSALHFRTGPNAKILAVLPRNTVLTSDGKMKGNWLHVMHGKKWGYVYKTYVKKC